MAYREEDWELLQRGLESSREDSARIHENEGLWALSGIHQGLRRKSPAKGSELDEILRRALRNLENGNSV
jgi:hypothetical protein